jgi:acyl-CoA reductase-like NAD-dependent aldehyde dehydrogenase
MHTEKVRHSLGWNDAAAAVRWNIRPFIDGRYRPSNSGDYFENVNPATEKTLCDVSAGDAVDVSEAVRVARQRFESGCWSQLTPTRRAQIVLRLADLLVEHKAELALLDSLEMGKPIRAALFDVDNFAPLFLRSAAGFADKLYGDSAPTNSGSIALNLHEPRGVVGLITPWNFPIVNAAIKLAPALVMGNTVVLKPSELAASSALRLAELALEAGIPPGVLNVVPGLGTTVGAALVEHPDVNLISFTGSTATGRRIMEMAGRSSAKPVILECGGKSPHVVFDDVSDLDHVAQLAFQSFSWNTGQVCSAHTRVLAHVSIKDALCKKIVNHAKQLRPADPLDERTTFGPLASSAQRDRVKNYVSTGLAEGAEAVLLGQVQESGGCFVGPTVFDRVQPQMVIAREEIFGPVLCIQSFQTQEDAIALANGTDYGLTATVWTRDMARGREMARAIKAGTVAVRTGGAEAHSDEAMLGHEPQKASGFGSETGLRGLQCYSTLKSISFSGA